MYVRSFPFRPTADRLAILLSRKEVRFVLLCALSRGLSQFFEGSFVKHNFCVFLEDSFGLYIYISAGTPSVLRFLVIFPGPSRKMRGC